MNTTYYLPDCTRYLTNQGLKYAHEFEEDTQLLIIDRLNNVSYTSDFEIMSSNFNTLNINTDHNFRGLVSTMPIDYDDYISCSLNDRVPKVICRINDKDLDMPIGKDLAIAMTLYVSSFFKKVDDNILSNPLHNRSTYNVFSAINNLTGIYFPWDKISGSYTMNNSSFFKSIERIEMLLLENKNIFESIVKTTKDIKYAHYKGFYSIDFKTYRLASVYASLLSLIGYKSRVKFNKELSVFRVSYTNQPRYLQHNYICDNIKTSSFNPITCYSIRPNNHSFRYVIVQNIDKVTMTSVLQASYNSLGDDTNGK